ncbi:MAG: zinc-dependent alcohol dehydrogenase [Desulfobacca sp.]|uniref:zinc-dependent alcohol dehydrogenase n=1 Tax=Desulfobacca sp. TaxID=2067990 RepID=UPI00404B01C8
MLRQALYFVGPGQVAIREEPRPQPGPEEVLVQTLVSAISSGTELLVYHNLFPPEIPVDATIPALARTFQYPLKYGYAAVGRVVATGAQVPGDWQDRLVFAFHPHESHFVAAPAELLPVPAGLPPELAAFLPNMETAVTLALDGAPLLGEQVVVIGQGIIGLLLTAVLAQMPLAALLTLDLHPRRRLASESLGATASLDPSQPEAITQLQALFPASRHYPGADLTYEVSGQPAALDQAIAITGFHGRIVIGSWYGRKTAPLHLGGIFHRSRQCLSSSQVSTISPPLSGRWSKPRVLAQAWHLLQHLPLTPLITHTIPFHQAPAAYELLAHHPGETLQVLLTYQAI